VIGCLGNDADFFWVDAENRNPVTAEDNMCVCVVFLIIGTSSNHCLNCRGEVADMCLLCQQTLVKTLGGCVCNFCSLGSGRGLLCGRGSCPSPPWGSVRAVFGRVRLCLGVCCVVSRARCVDLCGGSCPLARNLACWLCRSAPSLCQKRKNIYTHT
jgi:hypothetical protein